MTTAETVASVKAQSRVLYTDITGTTHNAIATDVPHLGYNQGLKRFSAFLNLVYLNDAGETVKIAAAPMIGEVDDEYLAQAAVFTAKHDVAWHDTSNKEELINDHLEVIKTHLPITIGWQIDHNPPFNPGFERIDDAYKKSSGIDGDAGAWTESGNGTDYPGALTEEGKRWEELQRQGSIEAQAKFEAEYPQNAIVESAAPSTLAPAPAQPTQPTLPVVSEEETAGTTQTPEEQVDAIADPDGVEAEG